MPEEEQNAAFDDYQRSGEISIKAARERKPQTAPPPPPPQGEEKNTPPAEPFREREQTPPPPAHCIPSTVKPPEIEWDNQTEAEMPGDGQQSAQDTPDTHAGEDNPEEQEEPTEAARRPAEAERQAPKETRCVGRGICPFCGESFDAGQATRYNTFGTQAVGPVRCPHCGKTLKILCSVEYICYPDEE